MTKETVEKKLPLPISVIVVLLIQLIALTFSIGGLYNNVTHLQSAVVLMRDEHNATKLVAHEGRINNLERLVDKLEAKIDNMNRASRNF